jgi:hypothetical protein
VGDFIDPDTGLHYCKKHDTEGPEECAACLRGERARTRRAVFDAAMALHGCGVDITFVTPTVQEIPWRLLDAFKAACRKAEEVEHG